MWQLSDLSTSHSGPLLCHREISRKPVECWKIDRGTAQNVSHFRAPNVTLQPRWLSGIRQLELSDFNLRGEQVRSDFSREVWSLELLTELRMSSERKLTAHAGPREPRNASPFQQPQKPPSWLHRRSQLLAETGAGVKRSPPPAPSLWADAEWVSSSWHGPPSRVGPPEAAPVNGGGRRGKTSRETAKLTKMEGRSLGERR